MNGRVGTSLGGASRFKVDGGKVGFGNGDEEEKRKSGENTNTGISNVIPTMRDFGKWCEWWGSFCRCSGSGELSVAVDEDVAGDLGPGAGFCFVHEY